MANLLGLSAWLLALVSPVAVFGAEPERVELRYLGGAACPSEAAFDREIKARIRRPVFWVERDPTARHVSVRVEVRSGRARGSLEIIDPTAEPTLRQFDAETCGEVASALALVVALALDPNARTEALPPAPEPPATVTAPAATVPFVAPTVARPPAPAPRVRFAFGPALTIGSHYAPVALATVGATFAARLERDGLFSPAVQLTPLYGKTGVTGSEAPLASFRWALARLDLCPLSLQLSRQFRLAPCVTSELGQLRVAALPGVIAHADAQGTFWADLGVSAHAEFVADRLFVQLGLSALTGLTRNEFAFDDPNQGVYGGTGGSDFARLLSGMLALGVAL